jgi:hypothetical protein
MPTSEPNQPNQLNDLVWLFSSLTDNGKSLRAFLNHPQELGVCILTAGLLANSRLHLDPDDAIKVSFEVYSKVQTHVARHQSLAFAANVDNCFRQEHPEVEQGEVEGD